MFQSVFLVAVEEDLELYKLCDMQCVYVFECKQSMDGEAKAVSKCAAAGLSGVIHDRQIAQYLPNP